MRTDTKHDIQWTERLPEAFRNYRAGRRIEEVECIAPDLVGQSRGKAMPFSKFSPEQTTFLPISLFYQTITGEYVNMAGIENQWMEQDTVLRPDMATASAVPWADDPTLQVIHDMESVEGEPVPYAPRNVLKRVLGRYEARGWRPVVAPELEFYLTKPNVDPNEPIEPPIGRTGRRGTGRQAYSMAAVDDYGPVIDTIYDFAEAQGLTIDTVIQEGGAGQIEINLLHGDPLELADQVFYFKRAIREAALRHGSFATFMAKPMREEPGSAMHIHQSVTDAATGRTIFAGPEGRDSPAFGHFIGGLQKYLLSVMPLMAPYVNSYRRYSTRNAAPVNLEWGGDNRTLGLRVPNSDPANRRIENRVIGIDANPYLAIAGSLACGYLGMEGALEPRSRALAEIHDDEAELPASLRDALDAFDADHPVRELLGEDFCRLFSEIKWAELDEFSREISPWERKHLLLNV